MELIHIAKFAAVLHPMKVPVQSRRGRAHVARQERRHKQLEVNAGGY
jgi:hypothetical protein